MPAKLNHTIVAARDKVKSALFLSEIMGLEPPLMLGHFALVTVGDELTLDFVTTDQEITTQHYAFLVSEDEFDEIFARIKVRGLNYWADPFHKKPGEFNHWDDVRGVYFDDPDGHSLEILTRPYGSEGTSAKRPHPLVAEVIDKNDDVDAPSPAGGGSLVCKEN
tara:strand:- start:5530 stop:6021 length:492 start_codon:yes stop_codon:yes gene_type:complete